MASQGYSYFIHSLIYSFQYNSLKYSLDVDQDCSEIALGLMLETANDEQKQVICLTTLFDASQTFLMSINFLMNSKNDVQFSDFIVRRIV